MRMGGMWRILAALEGRAGRLHAGSYNESPPPVGACVQAIWWGWWLLYKPAQGEYMRSPNRGRPLGVQAISEIGVWYCWVSVAWNRVYEFS